jgi:NhaP-type Na+/H+ or K+/H+ antiporter
MLFALLLITLIIGSYIFGVCVGYGTGWARGALTRRMLEQIIETYERENEEIP